MDISWVAFVGYFSLFSINIQEVVLKFQYLNKKVLITREHCWHVNLNIFSHPTFALITDFDRYGIPVSQMTTNMLRLSKLQSGRLAHSWLVTGFVTRVNWQMPHYLPLRSIPVLSRVCVVRFLLFCVMVCRALFVSLSFFCLSLCCLSFNLRLMITTLIFSNFSRIWNNLQ